MSAARHLQPDREPRPAQLTFAVLSRDEREPDSPGVTLAEQLERIAERLRASGRGLG